MTKKKRGYYVSVADGEFGVAVVANSAKEAKTLARNNDCMDLFCDCEYTEIEVKWKKDAKVNEFPIGVIENTMDGLKANIYDWVEEEECPKCGCTDRIWNTKFGLMCGSCEEQMEEPKELGYNPELNTERRENETTNGVPPMSKDKGIPPTIL